MPVLLHLRYLIIESLRVYMHSYVLDLRILILDGVMHLFRDGMSFMQLHISVKVNLKVSEYLLAELSCKYLIDTYIELLLVAVLLNYPADLLLNLRLS